MDELNQHSAFPPSYPIPGEDLPADLRAIAQLYAAQPTPRSTPQDTARLLTHLLAEETVISLARPYQHRYFLNTLRVARWRVRLLGPWFWIAGVLLLIFGVMLAPIIHRNNTVVALILVIPLTAVLSLAHALRTTSLGLREVEASCPVSFVEVTAGLVLAVVGFDCLLALLATFVLAIVQWAPFGALLAAWLGPLLLMVGISLPVALRWGTLPAAIVGGGPWLLLALTALLNPAGAFAMVFAIPRDILSLTIHLAVAVLGGSILLLLLIRGSAWHHIPSIYHINGGGL